MNIFLKSPFYIFFYIFGIITITKHKINAAHFLVQIFVQSVNFN